MQEDMVVEMPTPEETAAAEAANRQADAYPDNYTEEPAKPMYPTRMEEVEMLRIQNLNLLMSNNQMRHQNILNEVAAAKREQIELVERMGQVRQDVLKKYGVDLATHQINPDGTFSLRSGPGM